MPLKFCCCNIEKNELEHINSNAENKTNEIKNNSIKNTCNYIEKKSSYIHNILQLIKEEDNKISIIINSLDGIFNTNNFLDSEILIAWCWMTESVFYNLTKDNFPNVKEVIFISFPKDLSIQTRFPKWYIPQNIKQFFNLSETIILSENDIDKLKEAINNSNIIYTTRNTDKKDLLEIYKITDEIDCQYEKAI